MRRRQPNRRGRDDRRLLTPDAGAGRIRRGLKRDLIRRTEDEGETRMSQGLSGEASAGRGKPWGRSRQM